MKTSILIAAAFAANVNCAAIDARQFGRTTSRSSPGGTPDGTRAPLDIRNAQGQWPPGFSVERPTQSVTFWPNNPDEQLEKCGLDAFVGHTSEALMFCSSILKGGTLTTTTTYTARATTTTTSTVITTLYPPSAAPSSTSRPPSSTARPSSSIARSSTSSTVRPPTSTTAAPPSSSASPTPTTTPAPANCGIVGYTKTTAAYYFDSSGTKNNWAVCSAACKADSKCKSFGYGEANCMLFDVPAADNTNYNPMSPYTFYDAGCSAELPVKRQINISLGLGPGGPSSACSCLIPTGVYASTKTVVTSVTSARVTKTETVTRTVSLLPGQP